MAQYDAYKNPEGPGWLLDVQCDLLEGLNTRIVVPLLPVDQAPAQASHLNPSFVIEGVEVSMVTQYLAAVRSCAIRDPVTNFANRHRDIVDALDTLFLGF